MSGIGGDWKAGQLAAALFVGVAAGACQPAPQRLNAPPQGAADHHPSIHDYFAYQSDQGLMEDRSIADLHFLPHTAELSGTGQARLARYAELLATHGGTLTYDTSLADEKLVEARLKTARTFLDHAPGGTKIDVVAGMPGGRGMSATESIARRKDMLAQSPAGKKKKPSVLAGEGSGEASGGGSNEGGNKE